MKARLVAESINFERGQNPKNSMRLGIKGFIERGLNELIQDVEISGIDYMDPDSFHESANLLIKFVRKSGGRVPEKIINGKIHEALGDFLYDYQSMYFGNPHTITYYFQIKKGSKFFKEIIRSNPILFSINESINFERGEDPKRMMGIGNQFGFTKKMLGPEENDGTKQFWIAKEFAEKHLFAFARMKSGITLYSLPEDFHGTYGSSGIKFRCEFFVRFNPKINPDAGWVYGSSGSHGFNGGEQSTRDRLGKRAVKSLLNQLWDYLYGIDINESINFERGQDPKDSMGIGSNKIFLEAIKNGLLKDSKSMFAILSVSFSDTGTTIIFNMDDWSDTLDVKLDDNINYLMEIFGSDVFEWIDKSSFRMEIISGTIVLKADISPSVVKGLKGKAILVNGNQEDIEIITGYNED